MIEALRLYRAERNIALAARLHIRETRAEISEAHSPTHLGNTARLSQLVGAMYAFSPKELQLAYFAGWHHDMVRSPSEDPNVNDEERSAAVAKTHMEEMNARGIFSTTEEERQTVVHAVINHGKKPDFFLGLQTREEIPQGLPDRIHAALFVADKLEANGSRVIARRSSFVAGDRLHQPTGDWQKFGFEPDRDEALVVAVESILRLAFINPQYAYPERLRIIVDPLYEVQREFVRGVLKAKGLSLRDIASILTERLGPDGKSIIMTRKETKQLLLPAQPNQLAYDLEDVTGITDAQVDDTSEDVANSALETVLYFSSQYKQSLDALITSWDPRGHAAQRWHQQMVEYASGTWFKKIEAIIDKEKWSQVINLAENFSENHRPIMLRFRDEVMGSSHTLDDLLLSLRYFLPALITRGPVLLAYNIYSRIRRKK